MTYILSFLIAVVVNILQVGIRFLIILIKEKIAIRKRRPRVLEFKGNSDDLPDMEQAEIYLIEGDQTNDQIRRCEDYKKYANENYHIIWIPADYPSISLENFTEQNERIRLHGVLGITALILIVNKAQILSTLELVVEYDGITKKRHGYKRIGFNEWKICSRRTLKNRSKGAVG